MNAMEICASIVASGDCDEVDLANTGDGLSCCAHCPLHSGEYDCDRAPSGAEGDEAVVEQAKRYIEDHREKTMTDLYCKLYGVEAPDGFEVVAYRPAEDGECWLSQWGEIMQADGIRTSIAFPILKRKKVECDHGSSFSVYDSSGKQTGRRCNHCKATRTLGEWKKEGEVE